MSEEPKEEEETKEEEKEVEDESDWDFDFSQYDDEEPVEEDTSEGIVNKPIPLITGLRSRFSNWKEENERLAELNILISKYSIKTSARTQNAEELWTYYGLLDEYWESFRHIHGRYPNNEVNVIKTRCRKLLSEYENDTIPHKVHNNLLYLRSIIYRLKQFSNLGFEVERIRRGVHSRAKRSIEQ